MGLIRQVLILTPHIPHPTKLVPVPRQGPPDLADLSELPGSTTVLGSDYIHYTDQSALGLV